jgi:6-phosphogluconolactonase
MFQPRLFATLLTATSLSLAATAADTIAYVGTYTGGKSQGIYAFALDESAPGGPKFTALGLAAATPSPSFLAVDATRRLVFAVNETGTFNGQPTGSVSAFRADPATGRLALINQQPSMGTDPCHVVLDPSGHFLLVANYSSGSVAVFPVAADGRLGAPTAVIQHAGHSVDKNRQEGPHAHCVTFDPAGRYVFVCDLGLDRVMAYQLDAAGKLRPAAHPFAQVAPGSGPRHLAFSPDARQAYVLNELAATVTVFAYDASTGALTEKQTISTLPGGYSGQRWCAEIAVHPSGRWLYASNRGHNSVAQFSIDPATGVLQFEATLETGGRTPRHFAILPSAQYLVAANQESDTLRLCRIDAATGRLEPVGEMVDVPAPVCVGFLGLAQK